MAMALSGTRGACCQMSRDLVVSRLQGNVGPGARLNSLCAVGANGSAHAAATKVDAVIKRIPNALAFFLGR